MIGREEVLRVLTPIWSAKPEAARKLRQHIRATLRWAEAHGYVEFNVAGEGISGALPTMPAVREHFRALPYAEVASALETVEASGASMAAKLCLRFVVLTAARSGEGRGATWEKIDVDTGVWRISARRMKSGGEHGVPLSDAVLAILEQARLLRDESELVFASASRPGHPMSDMTLIKVLRATNLAERAATSRQLHHSRGHDSPVTTCTLACNRLGEKRRRPTRGADGTGTRDAAIQLTVHHIATTFGLTPTHAFAGGEKAGDGQSACDAVGQAWDLSFKTVERIWNERVPYIRRQANSVLSKSP